jgi:carboxylesterase type B
MVTSGSVYTPGSEVVATPAGGLPVVVWIHGGGYIEGAASTFNGADLIKESNYGVVTVLVQYRLGLFGMCLLLPLVFSTLRCIHYVLGFLSGEAVKQGGALNAGIRR